MWTKLRREWLRPGEGLRLGTVRRPPRSVPKSDFARLDYYDVWFPNLSPSAELVQEALEPADERAWAASGGSSDGR